MLLSEYDEQAHIESEKKIAREEGIQEGIIKGRELMIQLVQYLQKDGRLRDLELLSDEDARKKLYQEYNLTE